MTADLLDQGYAPQRRGQLIVESRPALPDVIDPTFRPKNIDDGQPDRAGERGTIPGVPERELPGARRNGVIDMLPRQHCADGGVAGTQPLRDCDDVGNQWYAFRRKPVARAAHPGHDFVEGDQKAVPLPSLRQPLPEVGWGRVGGQCRGADGLTEID